MSGRIERSLSVVGACCALALAAWAGGCRDAVAICGGLEYLGRTQPDTTTIKVGAATIAIAGQAYGTCGAPPARDYIWQISDSSIVAVTPIDSIHASILGLRPGRATVRPAYRAGGDSQFINAASVTVVP